MQGLPGPTGGGKRCRGRWRSEQACWKDAWRTVAARATAAMATVAFGCDGEGIWGARERAKRARGKDWREWGGRASGRGARGVALILSRRGLRGGRVSPRCPVGRTVGGGRRQWRGSGPHGLLGLAQGLGPGGVRGLLSLSLSPLLFLLKTFLFSFNNSLLHFILQ